MSDVTREAGGESGSDSKPGEGGQQDSDREDSNPGTGADNPDRHERVTTHPTPGPGNSLRAWYRHRNPLRVVVNYAVVLICRVSPSLRLKRWLLRRLGVSVGDRVAWGLESTPDVFWPDLITVEDDAVIGYDATLLCHEFLVDEYRTGAVVVGERAMVGAGAIILPGVRVGEGARVAANSLVTEDVPPGATVAGVPAEVVSQEEAGDGETSDRETA